MNSSQYCQVKSQNMNQNSYTNASIVQIYQEASNSQPQTETIERKEEKKRSNRNQKQSSKNRAGLYIRFSFIDKKIKLLNHDQFKVKKDTRMYFAAVLEYLAAEVLQGAVDEALKVNSKRITPKILFNSVMNDFELKQIVPDSIFWYADFSRTGDSSLISKMIKKDSANSKTQLTSKECLLSTHLTNFQEHQFAKENQVCQDSQPQIQNPQIDFQNKEILMKEEDSDIKIEL